jgi:hypothetical protein
VVKKKLKYKTTDGCAFRAISKTTGLIYLVERMDEDTQREVGQSGFVAMYREPEDCDEIAEFFHVLGYGVEFSDAMKYCDGNDQSYINKGWVKP